MSARGVRAERAVIARQVEVGPGHQRGKPMEQGRGLEDDGACAARSEGALELVAHAAVLEQRELFLREALSRPVADEAQETLAVVGSQGDIGVQGEAFDVRAAMRWKLVGLSRKGSLPRQRGIERLCEGDI